MNLVPYSGLLFVATIILAYTGIAVFAQLTGGSSHTALGAFLSPVRPVPLALVILANMFFALGLYWGFSLTRYALPVAFAIGVIVSFSYSAVVFGAKVSVLKIGAAGVIILGIVLLSL